MRTGAANKNLLHYVNLFCLTQRHFTPDTLKSYHNILSLFAENTPYEIEQIQTIHIENYLIRRQTELKASSLNTTIAVLKSFFSWLEPQGIANPTRNIPLVAVLPPSQRILSAAEYNAVCNLPAAEYNVACKYPAGPNIDCFKFLCHTGLRIAEFVSLTPANFTGDFVRVIGKGRKNRSIPLNSIARDILSHNPNLEMLGGRNRWQFARICHNLAVFAKIPHFHPHSCRHYFANELFHRGVDMYTISKLLGHSSTEVTETIYVHWSEESLRGKTDILED